MGFGVRGTTKSAGLSFPETIVTSAKKNIGKTIKIHRNDLNYPAFHCMIDKNHKYFYVIQGEVEYNDNISQSLEPNQFGVKNAICL